MTVQRLAVYSLVGWLLLIVIRVGMAIYGAEFPWPLGLLNLVLFVGIFSQYLYDWTRARTESEDRALFLSELADLVRLAVPPPEALAKLVEVRSKRFTCKFGVLTKALEEVSFKVSSGESLAIAFQEVKRIPAHWGPYAQFCEQPEHLANLLDSLAEAERSNLLLPYFSALRIHVLVPILVGVNTFIVTYILPTFIELFKGMDIQLPLYTRGVIGFSHILTATKIDAFIILASFILLLAISSETIRGVVIDLLYYLPGVRNLIKLEGQSHAFRLVGAGLSFGVPQRECLLAAARTCRVGAYRNFLRRAADADGSLIEQFSQTPDLFSQHFLWLLQQGEELENLPGALQTASEVAHAELGERTRKIGVQLDTFVLSLIGLFVGFCVLSIFVPIYMMIGNLG